MRRIERVALALLFPCAVAAQDRSLSWPVVSVTAHLDSTGALTVRESQSIRLSGDWNGAERTFNIRLDQTLALRSLTRVDAAGVPHALRENDDLEAVDDYAWVNNDRTLRWRARLPTDPPFNDTVITWVIDAVYDRILLPSSDGSFTLDHNFAMIDREGPIERFDLTLTLDSAWVVPEGFTGRWKDITLEPGTGYLVTIPLRYRGGARPANVRFGADDATRQFLAWILAAALIGILLRLIARERALGRFAATPDPDMVTEAWLATHVLGMLPEVAGAMWDDHTAEAEVAAVLARLVQEGKLSNKVETTKVMFFTQQELHLTLEVPRAELTKHERALIDGLFLPHEQTTSTSKVRERYKKTGFDPASTIRTQVETMVGAVAPGGSKPSRRPSLLLLLAGLVVTLIGVGIESSDGPLAITMLGASVPGYLFAGIFALVVQKSLGSLRVALLFFAGALAAVFGVIAFVLLLSPVDPQGAVTLSGLVLWCIGLANSLGNVAASRQSPERIAQRKRLFGAREFFRRELQKPQPALKDAWFPYVIAFGLGRHADKWFKAFGGEHVTDAGMIAAGASRGSSSGGSGWTGFGGGGGFSGGGSSASFAAAVGGMASSVPSPSSSSSGGGSSSGGSSGGGGGGGW